MYYKKSMNFSHVNKHTDNLQIELEDVLLTQFGSSLNHYRLNCILGVFGLNKM